VFPGLHGYYRLGELVMLKRMAAEDSDADNQSTTSLDSTELENLRLDVSSGTPSLASVFSGSDQSGDSGATPHSQGSSIFSFHKRSSSRGSADRQKKEDGMARWLSQGTVIYKSVGLGLMDLTVGLHLVKLAAEKKIGVHIPGF
jgi:hypothetical protein